MAAMVSLPLGAAVSLSKDGIWFRIVTALVAVVVVALHELRIINCTSSWWADPGSDAVAC